MMADRIREAMNDPSFKFANAVTTAVKYGRFEQLKVLLSNEKAVSSLRTSKAIEYSLLHPHLGILTMLSQHAFVIKKMVSLISKKDFYYIFGYVDILKYLLSIDKIRDAMLSTLKDGITISGLINGSSIDSLNELLKYKQTIDGLKNANVSQAVIDAAKNHQIFDIMISYSEVHVFMSTVSLKKHIDYNDFATIAFLLQHKNIKEGIRESLRNGNDIYYAAFRRNFEILDTLLYHKIRLDNFIPKLLQLSDSIYRAISFIEEETIRNNNRNNDIFDDFDIYDSDGDFFDDTVPEYYIEETRNDLDEYYHIVERIISDTEICQQLKNSNDIPSELKSVL